ncbi:6556_t:CDS:2 [Paraglomus occultum]|uniref:6556_t:CDS:1 n=1 Tax=Paraglomus occultum TaxID=144539 RepID=A0A9N8VHM4_9GLOM|nr:6556_t:CDS:2 [Paraglomus occultum]
MDKEGVNKETEGKREKERKRGGEKNTVGAPAVNALTELASPKEGLRDISDLKVLGRWINRQCGVTTM